MADDNFAKFIKILKEALKQSAVSSGPMAFDGQIESWDKLFKACDRAELIKELKKKLQQEELQVKDYLPLVTKINFLSASERDLRMRARNRVQALNVTPTGAAAFAQKSTDFLTKTLDDIAQ